MSELDRVLNAADAALGDSMDRLFELLRIPSVSTDPAFADECKRAGQWCVDSLKDIGFKASLRKTAGMPMVVAHRHEAGPDAPHVLFYGHYDVQPADPLERWHTSPFEPEKIKDEKGIERIYARGASDDKGQLMTFLEASRAWISTMGSLPVNVTVLLEGEEESGSPSLEPFLRKHKKELSCDVALVCDTGMWDAKTPAITTRLRGMVHEEVIVRGPRIDLHSGLYGGAARNPIHVLSAILAGLHNRNGKVMLEGFYEGVKPLPKPIKQQWDRLRFSARRFLGDIGLKEPAGETRFSALEQIWARPTAEVNGVIGGYTGAGTKTVIPSEASAKISFRLVGDQDPKKIARAFRKFVKDRLPKDCKAEFIDHGPGSGAVEVDESNPYLQVAASALKDEFRKAPVMMGMGGSIPIVGSFASILKMESLLVGFALNDDAIHSPNEKYDVASYHRGIRSWVRILDGLAQRSA